MKLLQRAPLLSALVGVSLLGIASAQGNNNNNLPNLSTNTQPATTEPTNAPSSGSNTAANTASNTGSASGSAATTGARTTGSTRATTGVAITGAGSSATDTGTVPVITGDTPEATDGGALPSGLPTLAGQYKLVPASVPPTQNAPFMQSSTLPEGTVFIAVGALLGFLALSVLLWRGMVAWSLHRSVKRAALQQNMSDTKALFRTPAAPYHNYHDRDSTLSLSGINASSLFFSPTAAAGGLNTAGNRASGYLPAGYYAAGAAQAGNNQSHISLGQSNGPSISLSNLGAQSGGYTRARSMGPSPPDSPSLRATSRGGHQASSSTLNLNQGYGGEQRAPSAYLEDLFDGENGPQVPGHHSNGSQHRF